MDPLTFAEDVEQRKRMLPMALGGTVTNTVQPGRALPMSVRARLQKVYDDLDKADSAEVDTSALQAFAKQQGESGQTAMLNALAAQFAGESFQPVQAQLLKRAAAAQEPMKIGGGVLTPDGQFVKDPFASRDSRRTALERQATALERLDSENQRADASRQDRLLAMQGREQQNALANQMRLMQIQLQQQAADTNRQRLLDEREGRISSGAKDLSKRFEDIVPLAAGVSNLNKTLAPYFAGGESKGIPGIGYGSNVNILGLDVSGPFLGEEGKNIRSQVQNIANALIRAEAGQAVTMNEAERQIVANMASGKFSERDFLNAYENVILPKLNEAVANVSGGFSPEVKQRYQSQGGGISVNAPYQSPRQTGRPAASNLSAQEQAELEALRKKHLRPGGQ